MKRGLFFADAKTRRSFLASFFVPFLQTRLRYPREKSHKGVLKMNQNGQFKKEMGLFSAINLIAGIMIGSGIFYIGGFVLERTNYSLGLSIGVWLIAGILTLLCGLCFAELGTLFKKAGGSYVYLREAYGDKVAFLSGFTSFFISGAGSNAALAIALMSVSSQLLPLDSANQKIGAALIIILLSMMNIFGVRLGALIQNISMMGKLIPILLITVCGVWMGQEPISLLNTTVNETSPSVFNLFSMVGFAIIASLWAYEGWDNLNRVTEELKDVSKNLPRAIIGAITLVTIIYTLFHVAVFRSVPLEAMQSSIEGGNYYIGIEAASHLFGRAGSILVSLGAMISIFGSLNGCILAFPRSYYAMANDGVFFKQFGRLHPKYGTPMYATIGQCLMSILLVFSSTLSGLTSMVVFSGWIFTLLSVYSLFIFRRRLPEAKRDYRVWGYPVVPIGAIAITTFILYNSFIEDPVTAIVGCFIPVVGLPVYYFYHRRAQQSELNVCVNESVTEVEGEINHEPATVL